MSSAQLRAFHAVAAAGGFTAAARALRLTQPAVTLQVRALERAYGVELFLRRGRQVRLTPAGEELFALTRRLFALDSEARDYLAAAGGRRAGRLRLAADGPYHLVDLLAAFRRTHPQVRIEVTIGNSAAMLARVLNYDSDLAVVADVVADRRLHLVPLRRDPVIAFVGRGHPWAGRRSVRLADFHGTAMVAREPGSATRQAFERALAGRGIEPNPAIEIGSREGMREAVAAGLGVGVVLRSELGVDPRLKALPIRDADVHTWEYVAALKERKDSGLIADFLALVPPATERPRRTLSRA